VKQTEKTLVAPLILAAVVAGLGLQACSGEKKPEEVKAERKEQAEKLFSTGAPDEKKPGDEATVAPVFMHLTVQTRGVTATLERQGDTWRLTSPVSGPADKWTVDGITSQLGSAKFKSTLAESPTDAELEKYGLKTPVFMVSAKAYVPDASGGGKDDPARQRTVTLYGGIENTFDGSVYVRKDGDPRVYAADGAVRYALEKDLYALRAKEFLGLDEASAQSIDVKGKVNAFTLVRAADKAWQLTRPLAQRADEERVKKLLQSLKGQRALSFPTDSTAERAKLGLDKPVVDARFTLDKSEPVRVRLSEVNQDGAATKVYALREQGSETTLAEVPASAIGALDVTLSELRDKAVLAFKREDVKRIVLYPGDGGPAVTLANLAPDSKTLDGWQVVAPQSGKAQTWKVAAVLGLLDKLKASGFGEANPKKWGRYGINETSRGAALQDASGKELARLWIGNEVPGKADHVYVRGAGNEVMEVELSRLEELPSRLEDVLQVEPLDGGSPAPDGGATRAQP
jgi:hypothetical protein